ncbi:MAG TPA: ribosome recycling factor [Bacteroidales bacterium]|jgi:ribosome recycling factor|nr:ribosome recycling factor [Bacteroidales bacterium]MDD4236064.1 ribosome recycling factor [Bacteroidales bacterium]MDY0159965.1 ribosome recycling factor [Bacteroidales bacterium]HXK81690.1 ribosome recycling factor [Bacteroidales bacterium]
MTEEVQFILDTSNEGMEGAIKHLEREFSKIRAGKASPNMLESIKIDYYGVITPLAQTANISTPDAKTIIVQPWDKSMIETIEKAIMAANLGFNPANNGELIRIIVPPLTEERRKQLAKQVRSEGETAKISIRNQRRDAIDEFKKLQKDGLAEDIAKDAEQKVHKMHEDFIKKVDEITNKKETEIMTI